MAFVSLFTGVALATTPTAKLCGNNHAVSVRAKMGDSLAPKIIIQDNKNETSNVRVQWLPVEPPMSMAVDVTGRTALAATLTGRKDNSCVNVLPASEPATVPPGVSPADFYFPKDKRNIAPVVKFSNSFADDARIDVAFERINQTVAGISSNEPDSVAFWKRKSFKYSAPEAVSNKGQGAEPISTALFEKYIPSTRRNFAPFIEMKKPAFEGDNSAYLVVQSQYVSPNPDLARQLSVDAGEDEPDLKASAVVEKYYGNRLSSAPEIIISAATETVSVGFRTITPDESMVSSVRSATAN